MTVALYSRNRVKVWVTEGRLLRVHYGGDDLERLAGTGSELRAAELVSLGITWGL